MRWGPEWLALVEGAASTEAEAWAASTEAEGWVAFTELEQWAASAAEE
jgi:hypothetical protein